MGRHTTRDTPVVVRRDDSTSPRYRASSYPTHRSEQCACDNCTRARLAHRIAPRSSSKHSDATATTSRAGSSGSTHQQETFPEVHVYPSSLRHIHFPVVNYTSAERVKDKTSWPKCYMAIALPSSKMSDFAAALAPPGSGHVVVARVHKTKITEPLTNFRTADKLFKESIQLEVWDENVPSVLALNRR
ncbi:hypothetical protein GGS26DRAFT_591077 [Hypomontagnella submonticulosa]|nr:hypothetical protein GGS26DRAFT_591077 [Hypomontagnella submonticulosa]